MLIVSNIHGKDDDVFSPFSQDVVELLVTAFVTRSLENLPPEKVGKGPGVYGLFYAGDFGPYAQLAKQFLDVPIYIGKAVVPGGRKGAGKKKATNNNYVVRRLIEHSRTISQTKSLKLEDFKCRWLIVVPEFVNAAEAILIDHYKPLWNCLISGFGIHTPGKGRKKQARSDWDMLHPGRKFALELPIGNSVTTITKRIEEHLRSQSNN